MIALITGASSGIGEELAKYLAKRGFNLILTARRKERLDEIKQNITKNHNIKVKTLAFDLSRKEDCFSLYNEVKKLNIEAVHILTKLFLSDFCKRNYGYILNTSSIAGYMAGPLMSTYYASKNYVLQLTRAISEELRHAKIDGVYIGALCPGPVNTEFNKVAGAEFVTSGASAAEIAEYAVKEMFKRKTVIIPQSHIKALSVISKMVPSKVLLKSTYFAQKARRGDPSDSTERTDIYSKSKCPPPFAVSKRQIFH